jgi:hypothetical protein
MDIKGINMCVCIKCNIFQSASDCGMERERDASSYLVTTLSFWFASMSLFFQDSQTTARFVY